MLKKLKTVVAVIFTGIFSMITVNAEDAKLTVSQEGTKTVVLSGCLGSENANVRVTAEVYSKGYNALDLKNIPDGKKITDIIKFHDQKYTDELGNYEFKFDITTGSEWISPYVGTKNITVGGDEYAYMYIHNEEWIKLANDINNAESFSEIHSGLNVNQYTLGFSDADLADIDKEELAKVILETVKDEKLEPENRDASWLTLRRALMIERLNEKKISNIYEEPENLRDFENSKISDWYEKEYITDDFKEELTSRLSGVGIKSIKEYKEALFESFVLATVNEHNGVDNAEDIMREFADEIDIDVKNVKDSVWENIAGEYYSDFEDLKDEYDAAKKSSEKTQSSGSSGGSSGGSKKKNNAIGSFQDISKSDVNKNTLMPENIFTDIDDISWAKEAIIGLAECGIIDGVGDNKFNPNGKLTREQFAKIAVGAFSESTEIKENVFSDVKENTWYAPFVLKAYSAGIVNGMGDGSFGVGKLITREDMCVMIYRAAVASGYDLKAENYDLFEDDFSVSDYAKEAVYALNASGAVSGVGDGIFSPKGNATRAQAAKIIYYIIGEV